MAIVENKKTLDLSDIQGMLTRGYSKHNHTAYVMLKVQDGVKGRLWLQNIMPLVDSGDHTVKKEKTVHLAFAPNGLLALGLHQDNLNRFPNTFLEGLVSPSRSQALGDYDENDPENWRWGQNNDEEILLILHARTADDLNDFLQEQLVNATKNGLIHTYSTQGFTGEDRKEPFGFHDGISQPIIKGSGRKGPAIDMIETGEFILGYKNEHGHFPSSPVLSVPQGDISLLKDSPTHKGQKDLGVNGSFMVFREMQQHVERFWSAMERQTLNPDGTVNEVEKQRLAAKCVGRWPSGASLVNYPDSDPGGSHENDDFGYAEKDPEGLKCPFGSHLRRNNPRDTVRDYTPKQSLKISRRHRIIRRGRRYELRNKNGEINEVGLHFLCFNTNIELQYEFIQYLWANNNQGEHLSNDPDILIGKLNKENPHKDMSQFTVQAEPVNKFYDGWEPFVNIKGGSYFFFPSISALHFLTTIE